MTGRAPAPIPLLDPVQAPRDRPVVFVGEEQVDAAAAAALREALTAPPESRRIEPPPAVWSGAERVTVIAFSPDAPTPPPPSAAVVYDATPWLARRQRLVALRGLVDALAGSPEVDGSLRREADFAALPADRPLHIHGIGEAGLLVRQTLLDLRVPGFAGWIDSDPSRAGQTLKDAPIQFIDDFARTATGREVVIIASQHWRAIEKALTARGVADLRNAHPFVWARRREAAWRGSRPQSLEAPR